jgi:hypothetical protein
MALRKVPTLFYDSRTLKVSVDTKRRTFYISAGLIIVGGESFFFKGMSGDLEESPCRIGIQVDGDFEKIYPVYWPKHGDELLVQAFYNIGPSLSQENEEEEEEEGVSDDDESAECKAIRATIKKIRYPDEYDAVRFLPKVKSINAICVTLDSNPDNFKSLATFIKNERLYQHLYGPISFSPRNIPTKDVEFAAAPGLFGECYTAELINNKKIVLI